MANLEETPTFEQVIRDAIEGRLTDVHVCLPAKVEAYDSSTQLARVQPGIMRKYRTGEVVRLPVINNVPVAFPRGGGSFMSFPLAKGDYVLLVFGERSIDQWMAKGGEVDPLEGRKHHLSDAIAYPGCYPQTKNLTNAHDENFVIAREDGSCEVHIKPDGTTSIKAPEILLGDHSLTEFVPISSRVETRLSDLEAKVNSFITTIFNLHTHPANVPPVTSPPVPFDVPLVPNPAPISSAKVKVDP